MSKKIKSGIQTNADAAEGEYYKNLGLSLKNSGNNIDAVVALKKAVELDSTQVDAHFTLATMSKTNPELKINMGEINRKIKNKDLLKNSYSNILYILKLKKQYNEALVCQEELCRLFPQDMDEKANHALLLNMKGEKEKSLLMFADLMNSDPENKTYKAVFFTACANTMFQKFEPSIKRALQACFENIYESNLIKVYTPWISTVVNDPSCSGIRKAERIITEDGFSEWIANASSEDLNFLNERFFLDGLRLLILPDPLLETFLKRLRKWLCLNFDTLKNKGKIKEFELFLYALSEQCFFNEYVFSLEDNEREVIKEKIENIKKYPEASTSLDYALVGCYQSLFETFSDHEKKLHNLSNNNEDFRKVVKTQFTDLMTEKRLKLDLKEFGGFKNKISLDVQAQYEENPYPRWISIISYPIPTDNVPVQGHDRMKPWKILIAGCGTGRQAMGTAATYPNAQITAIDLSTASLAYAKRKAIEGKLADRIDFIHADILAMREWPTQFDMIECSGVLHHMEDPFEGWSILTNLLKPGGFFKIGLYSESARKFYIEAQEFARKGHFKPNADGIRAYRDAVLSLPAHNPMRQGVSASADFYTTSLIRDLVFHVQEHRMNIPQIKEMMGKLNLSCTSFIINDVETIKRYDKLFPEDIDRNKLDNWDILEKKYPETFTGMYQFWCQKGH